MKNTYRKVKQFVKNHDDAFFTGAITVVAAATVVVYAVMLNSALAEEAKQQKEHEEWIQEQNFAGKAVYQLADGRFIAVSKDQVS